MSQYGELITETFGNVRQIAAEQAVSQIDADPEAAARSIQLSQATDVPASVINGDLPTFERNHKAQLAGDIIRSNQFISDYIAQQPMASQLSNDDYGQLDSVSQRLQKINSDWGLPSILGAPTAIGNSVLSAAFKGFKEGFGEESIGSWVGKARPTADLNDPFNRLSASLLAVEALPIELTFRTLSGLIKGAQDAAYAGVEQTALQAGVDPAKASRLGREAGSYVQMFTDQPTHLRMQVHPDAVRKAGDALVTLKPWLEQGIEPPVGIHPVVDQMKREQATIDISNLDEALREAQRSTTRERSPEIFAQFARQHTEAKIGISPEAIAELYKDKIPLADDGILGWVPDIQRQLESARATGVDVEVPLADWLARVEPDVAKALRKHIRVRPGGITLEEAKLLPKREGGAGSEPLQSIRESASLEPAFDIGDRKLSLQRTSTVTDSPRADVTGVKLHDFDITNNKGDRVAFINLVESNDGKTISIDYIQGLQRGAGEARELFTANSIGPAQMRDLLRQLKQEFPNAETLEGYRVSGARSKAATYETHGEVSIKLSAKEVIDSARDHWNEAGILQSRIRQIQYDMGLARKQGYDTKSEDWAYQRNEIKQLRERLREVAEPVSIKLSGDAVIGDIEKFFANLTEGEWFRYGAQTEALIKPKELYTANEAKLVEAVNAEIKRIAPRVEVQEAHSVKVGETDAAGVHIMYSERLPIILWALDAADPVGTIRHEAIHHLRQQGFFTEGEWKILQRAALENKWLERFEVNTRWKDQKLHLGGLLEEAIAEGFRTWRTAPESKTALGKVFQKLQDFFDAIKAKFREILGKDPTWEDLFAKADSGEIGSRAGNEPLLREAYRESLTPREPELPGTRRMEDRRPFEQGAMPVAMPEANYRRYMKAIAERRAEDIAAAQAKAEAEARRQQSAEWREAEPEARAQAVLNVRDRPDIATDRFFRESILYDQKLTERPKLNADHLTAEQIAKLPDDLIAKTGGLHPDDVAGLFGYETGAAMVENLIALQELRGKTRPSDFNRKLISAETQRLLKAKFGDLEENVLREAADHVASETQLNILHEEVLALGLEAKAEFPITKEQMKQWTQQKFADLPQAGVSLEKYLAASGRIGRAIEDALLKKDYQEAFRLKQQQYMTMQHAIEAKKFEREREQFEKTAKRFSQREVTGVEPEFTDFVQKMLVDAGLPVKRSAAEIAESIDRHGHISLEGFVKKKKDDGYDPEVQGWIPREGANIPKLENMTVQEFREFKDAIDSLSHIGREVNKVIIAGEKRDFADLRETIVANIKTNPLRGEHRNVLYMFDASLTRMEEIVKDLDLRQKLGPLWNAVIRPMIDAKHTEYSMFEDLTAKMVAFNKNNKDWRKTLNDTIPNNWFIDPRTDTPFPLTRESMVNIMLNFGNRSNIDKFTKGYFGKDGMAAGEARLWQMFNEHASKEDWVYAQHIWDLFEGWRKQSEKMYHELSGVAPKWIEPVPIDTPHGRFAGGYFPLIYSKLRSDIDVISEKTSSDSMFGGNYQRSSPSAHYTTERTGFAQPIQFEGTTEQVGARMQQVMHDIAYRPALMQAAKVLNDRAIRAAINNHYGVEYGAQIKPWLHDIAGQFNMNELAMEGANFWLKRTRIALIGNVLPLNLRVIFSPSVGVLNPVEFAKTHANHSAWMDIATEKSREITHTFRNMDRDFREQMEQSLRNGKITDLQSDALKWAYAPVVMVEQQFRLATWVGQYKEGLAKGLSEGDAAAHADSIVRERHTSAGVADLSPIMRSNEAMKALTVFYGWFNTQYNWMRQMPGQVRRGDWADLSKTAYGTIIIAAAFNYALFQKDKESDPWYKSAAKSLITVPFSNIPFGRDVANYFAEGYRPGTPIGSMIQYAGSVLSDVEKYRKGKRVEKPISHAANLIGGTVGMWTGIGLPMAQLGRTTQFGVDVYNNRQRPRNFTEWLRGIVTGEARLKP